MQINASRWKQDGFNFINIHTELLRSEESRRQDDFCTKNNKAEKIVIIKK